MLVDSSQIVTYDGGTILLPMHVIAHLFRRQSTGWSDIRIIECSNCELSTATHELPTVAMHIMQDVSYWLILGCKKSACLLWTLAPRFQV